LPTDHSSAAHGKRVRSAIAAHRRRSPRIAAGSDPRARLAEALGYLVGIEAKARSATPAEPVGAELVGVVIDPAAADAPPPRNLLGGDELGARSLRLARGQQLGQAVRQRLDRFGVEAKIAALLIPGAHRRLPKGPRLTFGRAGHFWEW
jgi:hypothetical protein